MPSRHTPIAPSELTAEQRALYDTIVTGPRSSGKQTFPLVDSDGALNGPFGLMLYAPELGQALQELGSTLRYRSGLSDRIREIAVLQVAAAARSEFELWAHRGLAVDAGLSEEEVASVISGQFLTSDPVEQACYQLVAELNGGEELSEHAFGGYAELIGRPEILELTVLVGYYSTLALSMRAFGIGVPSSQDVDPRC